MERKKKLLKSILIVDDNADSLKFYEKEIRKKTKAKVITTTLPGKAIVLANESFFDFILIDVTINYQDTQLGGFEVYKSLMGRYGDHSMMLYSQLITDSLLKEYDYKFNFIQKKEDPYRFVDECIAMMTTHRKQQKCFVAMPFAPAYLNIFRIIKESVNKNDYKCVRVDQQHFNNSIVEEIFSGIQNAKLVIFLATDKNPNAYYECGYSVAMGKEVITITDTFENLPFDIRDRNAISYGADAKNLLKLLDSKLSNLTS